MNCYCQSGQPFTECCSIYINGEAGAETPEILMRSRYSAYCTKNYEYLAMTTDPQAVGIVNHEANKEWAESVKFTGLEIIRSEMEKNKGVVEFKATFQEIGKPEIHTHHEVSKFRKQGGTWYFRDGKVLVATQS